MIALLLPQVAGSSLWILRSQKERQELARVIKPCRCISAHCHLLYTLPSHYFAVFLSCPLLSALCPLAISLSLHSAVLLSTLYTLATSLSLPSVALR